MIPRPIALGLTLCDQVIVEEGTSKVSVIGSFNSFLGHAFPYVPSPFCVFTVLTGAQGEGELALTVNNLETDEEVSALNRRLMFPDRFTEVRVLFRVSRCIFPEPGNYMFTLVVDDDWIVHRRVRVDSANGE